MGLFDFLKSKKTIKTPTSQENKAFDTVHEAELLEAFNKQKTDPVNQHFASIELQDFYYKYRDLDSHYLEQCIYYCEDDISKLNALQDAYKKKEEGEIKKLSSVYSKKKIDKLIEQITFFTGRIPAFQRLAVIYEKEKNYTKAISVCDFAISYYSAIGLVELSNDFANRKQKLEEKIAKVNK